MLHFGGAPFLQECDELNAKTLHEVIQSGRRSTDIPIELREQLFFVRIIHSFFNVFLKNILDPIYFYKYNGTSFVPIRRKLRMDAFSHRMSANRKGNWMDKRPTAGIILAAGMSTRFGKMKQLLELGDSTILSMVIDTALKSDLERVVLVLGHKADAVRASLGDRLFNSRLVILKNQRYEEGMSTSLKCGLMDTREEFPSIMVLMGDQPLLSHEIINLMLRSFRSSDKDICVPVFKGKRGLPVCFTGRFYDDILGITGDMGAREIIGKNPDEVLTVEVEDSKVFMDIDNEKDFEGLKALIKKQELK
jgi:molybdenum cofactor cytidylyltransferase